MFFEGIYSHVYVYADREQKVIAFETMYSNAWFWSSKSMGTNNEREKEMSRVVWFMSCSLANRFLYGLRGSENERLQDIW